MKKYDILNRIIQDKIIAVLRAKNTEEAIKVTKACIDGGIKIIEITFSTPNADMVISNLCNTFPDALIGAGTVTDSSAAAMAINSGAKFIVGPIFDKEIAFLCNTHSIPYIPGCMTVNEIFEAIKYGADIIKLFPASEYDYSFIKAVKAPFPNVEFMVTGGINQDNIKEWFNKGAVSVGIGGNLTKVVDNDFNKIKETAQQYIRLVNVEE